MKELISIIVPCYNEAEALPIFIEELNKIIVVMKNQDFEIIFIDDGSKDNTKWIITNLAEQNSKIRYISFSRNFGKEAAIYAGLSFAKGDYVVTMDVDLQDPPSLLPEMYHAVSEEGYDSVATRRITRKGEPKVRSFFARLFYKIINKMSKTEIIDGARDFRLMNRKFVNAILELKEYNRFSKGLFGWVGFKNKWIEFENVNRIAGKTKWSFWSLFAYSIEGIIAFTTVPLVISSIIGLVFCVIALGVIFFIVLRKVLFDDPVAGWPSLVCIITFIGGIQLMTIGVLGQYIAKMYLEIKKRPVYIIQDTNIEDIKL